MWFAWNSISCKHNFLAFECLSDVGLLCRLCRIDVCTVNLTCLHYTRLFSIPLRRPIRFSVNMMLTMAHKSHNTIFRSISVFANKSSWKGGVMEEFDVLKLIFEEGYILFLSDYFKLETRKRNRITRGGQG